MHTKLKDYGSTRKTRNYGGDAQDNNSHPVYVIDTQLSSPGDSTSPVVTRTTLTRFWILLIFSLFAWLHTVLWNTWGPINESVEAAFPTWNSSTVAMTANWTTIFFMIFVFPMCFAIQRFGMRNLMLLACALVFLGTGLRCITMTIPWFTVLAQLCSVLIGIASTLILSGPSVIVNDWFPVNERTTAFAVMMGASQLGSTGSYLEPLLVHLPGKGVTTDEIKHDITTLLYIGAGVTGALFLAVIVYFPSKPSTPPSVTSSTDRLDIISGLASLAKNTNFLLLVLAYGVSLGPPIAWVTVLNYSLLQLGFHQDRAMWIGLSSVLASSFFPILYGLFIDRFHGYLRSSLVFFMLAAAACFYWFLLLSYRIIPVSTWQVYMSVVLALTFNYTTIPLFFELAMEVAYPVPEILVSGILTAADNLMSTLFLLAFLIPNIGYQWMTITLVLCSSFTILPLLMAKISYRRANVDLSIT